MSGEASRPLRRNAKPSMPGRLADRQRWRGRRPGWPPDRSHCLMPELFRVALAYGMNPLTGRELEPWRVRSVLTVCRPNPSAPSVGDHWARATTTVVSAMPGKSRWWGGDSLRKAPGRVDSRWPKPRGAPPLDWLVLPATNRGVGHPAPWPAGLAEHLVATHCPRRVCLEHGPLPPDPPPWEHEGGLIAAPSGPSICDACETRPGVVLDPWAGAGGTLRAAVELGRRAIGIELYAVYAELAVGALGLAGARLVM